MTKLSNWGYIIGTASSLIGFFIAFIIILWGDIDLHFTSYCIILFFFACVAIGGIFLMLYGYRHSL